MKLNRHQIKQIQQEFAEKRTQVLDEESKAFLTQQNKLTKADDFLGKVLAIHGSAIDVMAENQVLLCRGGKHADYVVGDWVVLERISATEGRLRQRLPRRSWFVRGVEFGGRAKVIASNADQLVIIASAAQPDLKEGLIDRFLVLAEYGHLSALICVNKIDLGSCATIRKRLKAYLGLNYEVLCTSAKTGAGIKCLAEKLAGKFSLLVGHSGVGKSSLINKMLAPHSVQLTTGEVNPRTQKGRHTTARVEWISLNDHTVVLDTPGVREVGLALLTPEQITAGFTEIAALAPYCRFTDCQHRTEPDCAVLSALTAGVIHPDRYQRYLDLIKDLPQKYHRDKE